MIRASFCAPASAQAPSAQAPSASKASSTSPVCTGRCRLDPATGRGLAREVVPTARRASAAATVGSAGGAGATRGCDRARACAEAARDRIPAGAACIGRAAERGRSTRRGRGRTTRVSCTGAAGARAGSAERTPTPLTVVADGGSATAAPDGGLGSGTAAAGLGSGAGADGAATASAGAEGTLGPAGAAAGAGAGAGAGATGAAIGAAGTAPRAGRNESGSRYPCASAATRTPRWRYGPATSGSPLGPTTPTGAPSSTAVPAATETEPRCVSVTAKPSAVVIVSARPEPGTVPLNVTVPAAGASTTSPVPPEMSIPRCSPAAYGCAGSKLNGWRTGPSTGHVQARATGATSSAARAATSSTRRIDITSVVRDENSRSRVGATWPCCQPRLQSCHRVPR